MKSLLSIAALLTAVLGLVAAALQIFEPSAKESDKSQVSASGSTIKQSGDNSVAIQGNSGTIEIGRQVTITSGLRNDWAGLSSYANSRFQYEVSLPRGWSVSGESDRGDGAWIHSPLPDVKTTVWGTREEHDPERCSGYGPELIRLANRQHAKLTRESKGEGEVWDACQCNNGTCAGIRFELKSKPSPEASQMLLEIVHRLVVLGPPR